MARCVWLLLGLHTTHLVTDVADTLVLTVLMFTRHGEGKRFSRRRGQAFYWNFVVLSWLPIYALIYWVAEAVRRLMEPRYIRTGILALDLSSAPLAWLDQHAAQLLAGAMDLQQRGSRCAVGPAAALAVMALARSLASAVCIRGEPV